MTFDFIAIKDDPKFGFFKRPSKAKCWESEEEAA